MPRLNENLWRRKGVSRRALPGPPSPSLYADRERHGKPWKTCLPIVPRKADEADSCGFGPSRMPVSASATRESARSVAPQGAEPGHTECVPTC